LAPAAASAFISGSGLISLFSGMKPETIVPGAMATGNGRAAMISPPRWRRSAGMASRFASVALRSSVFWSEMDAALTLTVSSVMPGLVPGIHAFGRVRKQDVDGRDKRAFTPVFDGLCPADD